MALSRRFILLAAVSSVALAACAGKFETTYEPLSPAVTRGWHVTDVRVSVPASLKVSEAHSLLPSADIVWREDPADGDRHEQVAAIMRNAIKLGARGLHGPRPVVLEATVARFHALTFEAEKRMQNAGVHNIHFAIQVVDARTGAVIIPPQEIEASLPALSGRQMAEARARGESQKSQITAHVAATIAGWLGTGPDDRGTFTRLGD